MSQEIVFSLVWVWVSGGCQKEKEPDDAAASTEFLRTSLGPVRIMAAQRVSRSNNHQQRKRVSFSFPIFPVLLNFLKAPDRAGQKQFTGGVGLEKNNSL